MEFLLGLNEFTMSAMTILLLAILTATYRLNSRLVQYAIVGKKWDVTDKINKLGKRMVIFGGLATLPMVVLLLSDITVESELFSNLALACYIAWIVGYFILIVALPALLIALVGRVHLSELSMATVLMTFFKPIKNALQPYSWRKIALAVVAIMLLVVIWPLMQGLLYIGIILLLARFGALDDYEKRDANPDDLLDLHNVTDTGYSWEHGELLMEEHGKRLL